MKELTNRLVDTLPVGMPRTFNPWREACQHDTALNGPEARLERLARHLDCAPPRLILAGEAPGYQGCRYSGVAFTSERLLLEGVIPRIDAPSGRLTNRPLPFSEPSATIVWKTLYRLGVAEQTILWNSIQLHPFKEGDIWSNRTPSDDEIAMGMPAIRILADAFPDAMIVAVGKKAGGLLRDAGIPVVGDVRHPANGGATQFAEQLSAIISNELIQLQTAPEAAVPRSRHGFKGLKK